MILGLVFGLPPVPVPAAPAGDASVPVSAWRSTAEGPGKMPEFSPRSVVWPTEGSALVPVDALGGRTTTASAVGGLPIRLMPAEAQARAAETASGSGVLEGVVARAGESALVVPPLPVVGPAGQPMPQPQGVRAVVTEARVTVLGQAAAAAAGVKGVLLTVARADDGVSAGELVLDVDVSGFSGAFGGDWGRGWGW